MLCLFAAMLAVLPARDPIAPHLEKPVVEIVIEAPEGEQVANLKKLVGIYPGYLLASADVNAAIKRLYALGRFSKVDAYVEPRGSAVALSFVLEHVRQLSVLRIDGLSHVRERDFREALRLQKGGDVERRTQEQLRARARDFLARVGFPRAEVEVTSFEVRPGDVEISIRVDEGPARLVRAVEFIGEPRLAEHHLAKLILTREGGVLDLEQVERDRERLLAAYLERGFAYAVVARPRVESDDEGGEVSFSITANRRVSVHFSGNHALADRALLALWPNADGSLQPGDLELYARRITEAYRRLGYHEAQVTGRGAVDREGIERYLFRIIEGARPVVGDVVFTGAEVFSESVLRRQVEGVLLQELGADGSFQPMSAAELKALHGDGRGDEVSWLPPTARFVEELYEKALEGISAAYRDRGYLEARVGPAKLEQSGARARVLVPVFEGSKTVVRALVFEGEQAMTRAEFLGLFEELAQRKRDAKDETASVPLAGAPLSEAGVEEARLSILRRYRDSGYLYARVSTRVVRREGDADITFTIEEGPEVRVETIIIRGNRHTRTDLIESRMELRVGEPYRLSQALQDQRAIDALGVFSSVRVRLVDEQTPAERKDVVAEVTERPRQAFELWPGVSTADGPRLRIVYSHLNLFGTATGLNLSLKLNQKTFFSFYGDYGDLLAERYDDFDLRERTEVEARVGLRSPRFFAYPLDTGARFDLVGERQNAISYSLDAARVIFGVDTIAFDRLSLSIDPQLALTNLTCFSRADSQGGDCQTALLNSTPYRRRVDEGLRALLKLGPSITLDLRDNIFEPRRGLLANARLIYGTGAARVPGSSSNITTLGSQDWLPISFTTLEASLQGYVPLGKTVLALSARGGTVLDGTLPLDERFYLGGSTTMRGYAESAMLPDDVCVLTDSSQGLEGLPGHCVWRNRAYAEEVDGELVLPLPTGGDHFALFKVEWRIYVGRQILFNMFVDAGNLWLTRLAYENVRLRINPGVGLRYSTPAGPIGLDVGFNPAAEPLRGEPTYSVQFAVGVF